MNSFSAACFMIVLPFSVAQSAAASCQPEVVQEDTSFPERAELRGQKGIVLLDVLVDESGHAAHAEVVDSSGYRLLDRSAEQSVLRYWHFNVSRCERKDLPIKHRVAVEYRNEEY